MDAGGRGDCGAHLSFILDALAAPAPRVTGEPFSGRMAGGGVYPLVDIGAGAGLSGARPSRGGSVDPALGPLAAVPDRRHLRGWAWRRHRIAGERPAADRKSTRLNSSH